jgi:hypothetical protein
MIKLLLPLSILVSACVAIHGVGLVFGLRWPGGLKQRPGHHFSLPAMFLVPMFVWSTAALFTAANRLLDRFLSHPPDGEPA